jgi:hypothetical protein
MVLPNVKIVIRSAIIDGVVDGDIDEETASA